MWPVTLPILGRWPETCYAVAETNMTCRYAHKRIATLFTVVQATPAARVIEWPIKGVSTAEQRAKGGMMGKSQRETLYASK